jgi:outer membrane receptor for ferrienterochelin and colicin
MNARRARAFCTSILAATTATAWLALKPAPVGAQALDAVEPTTMPSTLSSTQSANVADAANATGEEGSELMLYKDIPVVVAAGMREQTLQQAAASVSIVNANDIELFNYRSLADVLRDQRSFYIYSNGLNSYVGARGLQIPGEENNQILVLEDGRPTNELINGQSHFDQGFGIPMEAMKQVEIIRGT